MENQKTVVISLGGSLIVPDEIQTAFLKQFKEFILKFIRKDYRFVIVTGGGSICRKYQKAAAIVSKLTDEDKDWLGIHATRLNAHLIRTIFKKEAYPVVLDSPHKPISPKKYPLYIASGWKPGWSTDFDAVILAKRLKAQKIVNLSNIDYIYDKNPKLFKDAKPIKEMKWPEYLKIVGTKWIPGMNAPFDPVASKIAKAAKMTVAFIKGTDLENLARVLTNKKFKGTIIS
jgi:uridylate kinase